MRLGLLTTADAPHPTKIDLHSRETAVFGLPMLHRAVILAKRYLAATIDAFRWGTASPVTGVR